MGYATPDYAGFGSLETNIRAPWDWAEGDDGRVFEYEEEAVAALLWDLVDDTPSEDLEIVIVDGVGVASLVPVADRVAIEGGTLVRLLAAAQPETIVDVYEALVASGDVPDQLKAPDTAYPDLAQAISPIDEVFLLHRFYPIRDPSVDRYYLGDPIARTDRPWNSAPQVVRRHIEPLPGSAIRLSNPGSSPATYAIDVSYPDTSSHFEIAVAAASEKVVHLELPPYWSGTLAAGTTLPPCANAAAERRVTVTVSGPAGVARTFDNCEYQHAILTAVDGAALTIGERVGGPDPTPGPTQVPAPSATPRITPGTAPAPVPADGSLPVLLAVAVGIVVLGGLAAIVVVSRRKRQG